MDLVTKGKLGCVADYYVFTLAPLQRLSLQLVGIQSLFRCIAVKFLGTATSATTSFYWRAFPQQCESRYYAICFLSSLRHEMSGPLLYATTMFVVRRPNESACLYLFPLFNWGAVYSFLLPQPTNGTKAEPLQSFNDLNAEEEER